MARCYLADQLTPEKELHRQFLALIMRSCAKSCIIPMQDYLGLDNSCRINKPSTLGSNWRWRVKAEELTDELKEEIRFTTKLYGRLNWN